jgi:outer membrane immunogenic protein
MRKLLLSLAALAALAVPAAAADLPRRDRVVDAAPVVLAPAFTWAGAYVGVNAGMGFNKNTKLGLGYPEFGFYDAKIKGDAGFVGGAQAGYNWQWGQIVVGAETDIQYADLGKKDTLSDYGIATKKGDYFGTVRGRLGYAFGPALIYATGGFAYGDVGEHVGPNEVRYGWTAGAGAEYAFASNWTVKAEGLYVNLDRARSYAVDSGFGPVTVTQSKQNAFTVARVGLNYKF